MRRRRRRRERREVPHHPFQLRKGERERQKKELERKSHQIEASLGEDATGTRKEVTLWRERGDTREATQEKARERRAGEERDRGERARMTSSDQEERAAWMDQTGTRDEEGERDIVEMRAEIRTIRVRLVATTEEVGLDGTSMRRGRGNGEKTT